MHARHRLAVAGAAVALAVSTAVVSAVPAAASSSYATLFIRPSLNHPGYYVVGVTGHVHGGGSASVTARLFGDDPVFNDDLEIRFSSSAYGSNFGMEMLVWGGWLDEDPEGGDEIFAKVSASNGWSTSTANVSGHF